MDLSVTGVFVAGLLTFLSPCVLPVAPVYLSILAGDEGVSRWRGLLGAVAFVAGFTLVFSLLGLSATVVGRAMVRHKLAFQQVGGIVVLLLGLRFVGWLRVPFLEGGGVAASRFGTRFRYLNAFVLGLLFAFAWSPCIGSVLGAVLTLTSLATTDPLEGMGWLALYGLGFGLPLLALAAVAGPALAALRRVRRFIPVFERVTGVLLVAVGFLVATDRLGIIDSAFATPPDGPVAAEAAPGAPQPSPKPAAPASPAAPLIADAGAMPAVQPPAGATCGAEPEAGSCGGPASPVVYKFHSPNCPICRQMIPVVSTLKNECLGRQVRFEDVDVSTPAGRELARRHGVTGIPVFLFVDPAEREVARLVGYQSIEALERAMSVLIGEECPGYRRLPGG
ncbi:MAG: thioredoxin fold domain-containing protein [Deltaproteobacteria bacterium]|nr:thioredoxin fold domain-containing protein [Deltaproteobacteria bacterium]